MDTGLTLKSVANLAQMSDPRPDPAARAAVATELAPAQAVTAASGASNTRSTDDSRVREIVLDPQSREVLYRAMNARAAKSARHALEDATRKLKAYLRTATEPGDESSGFDKTA